MGGKIDCYIDIASLYSFFAFVELLDNMSILEKHGVQVEFHPVTIHEIHQLSGNVPPSKIKAKGEYLARDSQRAAARVGKRSTAFPADFANMSLTASPQSALLYIKEYYPTSTFLSAMHYMNHIFWTPPHVNLSMDNELQRALQEATEALEGDKRLFTPEDVRNIMNGKQQMKDYLDQNVQDALQLGAFGLPWIVATTDRGDTDRFFGSDRFIHVYEFLSVPFKDVQIVG